MLYNIDFDICSIIINVIVFICLLVMKDMHRRENKLFMIVILTGLFSAVFDIISAQAISSSSRDQLLLAELFTYLYLMVHNATPYIFCIYVTVISGTYYKTPKYRYFLLAIPLIVDFLLLLTNPFSNKVFYFDSALVYHRGDFMNYIYAISFFYIFFFVIHIMLHLRSIPRKRVLILLLFFIAGALTVLFQYFFPYILIELFVQSVVYIAIMLNTDDELSMMDTSLGIYNRSAFIANTQKLLRSNNTLDVILIKLTNITSYRTLLGYDQLAAILYDMTQWLKENCSPVSLYTIGYGVFAMELYDDDFRDQLDSYMNTLMDYFSESFNYKDINISFETQLLAIHMPSDLERLEDLLTVADQEITINQPLSLLSGKDLDPIKRSISVDHAVRDAMMNDRFQVYFQPIYEFRSGAYHSAEALARLEDPILGSIPPGEFIRVAEKNGTILQIGELLFEQLCSYISKNHLSTLGVDYVSFNLSSVQCMQKDLTDRLWTILNKYGVPAYFINLEIPEASAMENVEAMRYTIEDLRKIGFSISLDDFGTSNSNVSGFYDFSFDVVKIDKQILWNGDMNDDGNLILSNCITLGKRMSQSIVVEGVETEAQKEKLRKLGCDFCQGFLFGQPLPGDAFLRFLRENNFRSSL
ncbi:MAG: EAL domain-containing protein [Lachnospiraceae bacterium]|nr:EAL domain-containing protein [Lachnospiraceae bacterium]